MLDHCTCSKQMAYHSKNTVKVIRLIKTTKWVCTVCIGPTHKMLLLRAQDLLPSTDDCSGQWYTFLTDKHPMTGAGRENCKTSPRQHHLAKGDTTTDPLQMPVLISYNPDVLGLGTSAR